MRHRFQHFLKFLVHSDPKSTNKALISKKKTQTQSICNQIIFGNQLQTFPQKAIRKNFNLKRETQLKNMFQQRSQLYLSIQSSKKKLHPVSVLYVWTTLEHQVKDENAIRKIQTFFWASQARNSLEACARPPTSECFNKLHYYLKAQFLVYTK